MLDGIDHVDPDAFVPTRSRGLEPKIFESLVLINLPEFRSFRISPEVVPILTIKFHRLLVVLGYSDAKHVNNTVAESLELRLVGHLEHLLLSVRGFLEPFPPNFVEEMILLSIDGN